jgi:hypothetical protein
VSPVAPTSEVARVSDEITLRLPRARDFYGIAHLVLGGLAVRLDLTFETLEDLQLALASVLERPDEDGDVDVTLRVVDGSVQAVVGPFEREGLQARLGEPAGDHLSLARLLEAVVDRVDVDERAGGAWVALTKHVQARSD